MISLTPLIDVVFILLVFFMLASSLADYRSLPLGAGIAGEMAEEDDRRPIVIALTDAGGLTLDGDAATEHDLADRVRQLSGQADRGPIILRAAETSTVGDLVGVMDRLGRAGIGGVALAPSEAGRASAEALFDAD